jgi:hypothetical protein
LGPLRGRKKSDFFLFSSPLLYESSFNLNLISNTALPLKKRKLNFNLKKWGISFGLILLSIVIKSICQYFLGAQDTSLSKLLLGLDYSFYGGIFLGGILMSFTQDNWDNMRDYFYKSITIKLDSDDDSGNESLNNNPKGKEKLTDSKAIYKDKSVEQATSKKGSSSGSEVKLSKEKKDPNWIAAISEEKTLEQAKNIAIISLAAHEIREDTLVSTKNILGLSGQLKMFASVETAKTWNIDSPVDTNKAIIPLAQEQAKIFSKYVTSDSLWLKSRAINLEAENKIKVDGLLIDADKERGKYLTKLGNIPKHENPSTQAKLFYAALNEQMKSVNKHLNIASDIVIKDLKTSDFCKLNHEDCKNLIKALNDHSNARKEFNLQANNLKKVLGEVINRRN